MTVRQHHNDYGVFTCWGARTLLTGQSIPLIQDASKLGTVLRALYVGEIRSAVEGTDPHAWNLIFNRGQPHEQLTLSPNGTPLGTKPAWMPFLIGIRSSNTLVFRSESKGTQAEVDKVANIIKDLQKTKGGTMKVLLLFAGVDALTTNKQTWMHLITKSPGVDFSLTSVCPERFSVQYPSVSTVRFGYAWAHLEVTDLQSAFLSGLQTTIGLLQEPKYHRWIHWLDVLLQKKIHQNQVKQAFSFLERRLTVNHFSGTK